MSLSKLIEAVEAGMDPGLYYHVPQSLAEHAETICAAHYGSLDAAKRLHDALLPGWDWLVRSRSGYACVYMGDKDAEAIIIGMPTRAWLLSILRALEGKEGGE